ncbi:MAG: DNA polymerase III subunit delta' [cyanobacterium endosymbiont of Rhopalodia musculus]|uniref:DNA polymerase III subunit delta' n=1 Tax=cyanobacterium endosymbiont of Epithemia clementina EcSB TaxID=3034674 RepID=UPI00247FA696|nr:DNA polymerase III subunit delta' [cyanobacterium endosymbiont of Epithemia clementina EcSB]WGT67519.1 DNA polymerase III subunit delta' [cyanobacterium endosymbiont of Epithemia clementina EcSB]
MSINPFQQLIGQSQAVELLEQVIAKNRIAPAYLFTGPVGVGRSLGAKCFSEALLCVNIAPEQQVLVQKRIRERNHPDLLWVEPTYQYQGQLITVQEAKNLGITRKVPPQIRIEQIREVTRFLSHPPLEASRSLVIIEDAQTMTEAAANGLLKTLEEPGQATLILLAININDLIPTLISRCQKIPFHSLSFEDLIKVFKEQKNEVILKNEEIISFAQGSPGEAIFATQQLDNIPKELYQKIKKIPSGQIEALELSKIIAQKLDIQTQLWLIKYLQYYYWTRLKNKKILEILEKSRLYLLSYVQSQLVWECLLLEILSVYS